MDSASDPTKAGGYEVVFKTFFCDGDRLQEPNVVAFLTVL